MRRAVRTRSMSTRRSSFSRATAGRSWWEASQPALAPELEKVSAEPGLRPGPSLSSASFSPRAMCPWTSRCRCTRPMPARRVWFTIFRGSHLPLSVASPCRALPSRALAVGRSRTGARDGCTPRTSTRPVKRSSRLVPVVTRATTPTRLTTRTLLRPWLLGQDRRHLTGTRTT